MKSQFAHKNTVIVLLRQYKIWFFLKILFRVKYFSVQSVKKMSYWHCCEQEDKNGAN